MFSIHQRLSPFSSRIGPRWLVDRDHCIGHAYLLALHTDPTLDGLKRISSTAILPLRREHFFGDQGKIGLVLGRAGSDVAYAAR